MQPAPDSSASAFERVTQFFSNPVIGFAGAIASLIGIPLAIYFYIAVSFPVK
jgi:hypothetical protein